MRDGSEVRTSRNAGCEGIAPAVRVQAYLVEAATGRRHSLRTHLTTIGRRSASAEAGPATLTIDDPYLSRRHAQILLNEGHCWLVDLESANGSFVNARPVAGPTALRPGDVIWLGTTQLSFETAAAEDGHG